jgi:aspartyl-tRNA(Asn)/glutamyl-tRNA(Gln) amidotransferase subunit B
MNSLENKYEVVIGLEVHVQLNTLSKAFCGDPNQFGTSPNENTSIISLAYPGTLPKANKTHIHSAIKMGLAINSEINKKIYFDRKNYFYPDLPKGYQITQDNQPICLGGEFILKLENGERNIRIHHIHMEEDAGKSIHDLSEKFTLLDYNRAGVPLLEMVTEPDLRSGDETLQFIEEVQRLVRYLEISDGRMEEGSLRADCNISVRPKGQEAYNNRVEIKNVNSKKFAKKAIEFETTRQIKIMEEGGTVKQETRGFDVQKGITIPQREKENVHDYRYFPEPDLCPMEIDEVYLNKIKEEMPLLPKAMKAKLKETYGLSDYDADILSREKEDAVYFMNLADEIKNEDLSKLVINKILPWKGESNSISDFPISNKNIKALLALIKSGKISAAAAYSKYSL